MENYGNNFERTYRTETQASVHKYPPVYMQTQQYAACHGETAACEESDRLNLACRDQITETIRKAYSGHFDMRIRNAVMTLLMTYGRERVSFVLADTIQFYESFWEGTLARDICPENRSWAARTEIPAHLQALKSPECCVWGQLPKLDGFVTVVRKMAA